MTVAPMRRPKDCATSCVSITVAQFAKKAPAVRLRQQASFRRSKVRKKKQSFHFNEHNWVYVPYPLKKYFNTTSCIFGW